jgi:hypothetical protein
MEARETLIDLKSLSTDLINSDIDSDAVKDIIDQIHSYFREVTEISGYGSDVKNMITLPATNGMALSINHAAQCLLDYKRTYKFLKGFVNAIKDKQKEYPNKTIQVFYAGCGPYAPFVTLVAPLFTPEEVQFSLLEINKDSLEKAEILIENLKLTAYIKKCYLSDATTFKLSKPKSYHILFSETLDALLYRECYVPILWNLVPQFSSKTTVIPENVKVDLFFKEKSEETFVTTIFDVEKAVKPSKPKLSLPEQFESVRVDLTQASKYDRILLATEVQVYKDLFLVRNESSLTLTLEMEIEKPIINKAVLFTYHTKPSIELKFTLEK